MAEFPERLPDWLKKPTKWATLEAFYVEWHGPAPHRWMDQHEQDTYLSLDHNVELNVSRHDDPLDRPDGEHDCGKFTLSYGPGLGPPNADHHFTSESWDEVLLAMEQWGLIPRELSAA